MCRSTAADVQSALILGALRNRALGLGDALLVQLAGIDLAQVALGVGHDLHGVRQRLPARSDVLRCGLGDLLETVGGLLCGVAIAIAETAEVPEMRAKLFDGESGRAS